MTGKVSGPFKIKEKPKGFRSMDYENMIELSSDTQLEAEFRVQFSDITPNFKRIMESKKQREPPMDFWQWTILLQIFQTAFGYKILGIFPSMSKSHFIIGNALMKELAEVGHEVTVISPYPQSSSIPNYRDIDVQGIHKLVTANVLPWLEWSKADHLTMFLEMNKIGFFISNHTLHHPAVQNLLYDPSEHFDVIIMEIFLNEALLGIGYHLKAPVIGLSTFCSSKWSNDLVGTPAPPSYVPSPFLPFTDKMNFFERVANTAMSIFGSLIFDYLYMPIQENIYDNVFPDATKPKLWQLRQNVSLVLLNTHFTLNYPNPYVPNMIEVGGMQLKRRGTDLPKAIQDFLDGATNGAIYFSMGTNIKSSNLSPKIRSGLIGMFSKLKQRVLWKWDEELVKDLPENVFISKWLPQDDILRHPNIKIFITHGGLLGLTEAIYHAVPIIGIPVFGDQNLNIAKAVKDGYGIEIRLDDLNENTLHDAIVKILNDNSYKKQINDLSTRFRDQPMDPLATAVYWVEYIARHKGASFLQSAAQDLNLFQYHSLDVFGFLALIIFIIFYSFQKLVKFLINKLKRKTNSKLKTS